MRPGNTSLPDTSRTSLALSRGIAACTAATRPSCIATSRVPSIPCAGSITRPPLNNTPNCMLGAPRWFCLDRGTWEPCPGRPSTVDAVPGPVVHQRKLPGDGMQARAPWSCKVHVKCVPYRQSAPTDCGATGTMLIATSWGHKVREGNITQEGVTHGTHTLSTRHAWNNRLHFGPDQPVGVSYGYWRITGLCPSAGHWGKAQV